MVTSTAKKWFVLMAAAIVIAFSGCSDGGGGDGGYTGWGWRPSVTDFNDVLDDQGISRPANYNTLLLLPGTAAKIQAVVWSLVVLDGDEDDYPGPAGSRSEVEGWLSELISEGQINTTEKNQILSRLDSEGYVFAVKTEYGHPSSVVATYIAKR